MKSYIHKKGPEVLLNNQCLGKVSITYLCDDSLKGNWLCVSIFICSHFRHTSKCLSYSIISYFLISFQLQEYRRTSIS